LGTTKPGTLLEQAIPIRTFADWDDLRPGFVDAVANLVAHCNPNRGQKAVSAAIHLARQYFPSPILGLDSDNGSEFINANLLRYCQQEHTTFTRSRPYKKNNQAHVEQKNRTVVRQIVGYDRYEGPDALAPMEALYKILRLYVNFFQPVMKLASKQRVGGNVRKKHDVARTPFRRVLDVPEASNESKVRLMHRYLSLNPAALLRQIHTLQEQLWRLAVG